MFRFKIVFLALVGSVLIGCGGGGDISQSSAPQSTGNVTPHTQTPAYQKLHLSNDFALPQGALFLDIRNAWEREGGWSESRATLHTVSNTQIPYGSRNDAVYEYRDQNGQNQSYVRDAFVSEVLAAAGNDRTKEIVLICHTGSRSEKAAKLLVENGFTHVEDIAGGVQEWQNYHLRTGSFTEITPTSDYKIPQNTLFLDIRNAWERNEYGYAQGSIGGAVYEYREPSRQNDHLRPEFVSEVLQKLSGDRSKPVILICHSSSRSYKAAKLLVEHGFTAVSHIKGGLNAWQSAGLPVVK